MKSSYHFPLDDKETWLLHLREKGYVVLAGVVSLAEVEVARNLVWRDLQSGHGVDDATFGSKWNFVPDHGIVTSLAQTAGPWHIRGNGNIHKAFSYIWDDKNDLITSMDAVLLWPGCREPHTEGLHVDQNPFTKPTLDCIQGMVPLLPVTPEIGGLEVVPYSHTEQAKDEQCNKNAHWEYYGNFCTIFNDSPYVDTRQLLECSPGDLILWDSRLVHGGLVGTGKYDTPGLVRMSITVAMTPREWATPEVQEARRHGFEHGLSFNHCPHEANSTEGRRKKSYHSFELTKSQEAVL